MAPLDFKHMTSAKYRPGEDDAVNYYAQKRKKQYHGNEGKEVKELSMKPDKKLPNLKVPVKGKKGISRFMRKKAISKAKDDLNASVQSADRKPEKYIKPDGKVGIRMVKTDKEVINKEQMQVYKVGHKDMSGNVHATTPEDAMRKLRKKGLKGNIKLTHRGSARSMPTRIIPRREELDSKDKPFVKKLIGKLRKGSNTHAKQADDLEKAMKTEGINHSDAHRDAQTHSDGSMSVKKIPSMIKKSGDKHLHLHMKSYHKEKDGQAFAKKHGYKVKNYVKTPSGTRMDIHKEAVEYPHMMYDPKTGNEVKAKTPADHNKYAKMGYTHEKPKVDEASMSPMNLKRAEKFMGPSKNFNQAVNFVSKGMKVSKQQAIKMVKKILGVNPKTNKIDEEAEVLDHGSLKKDFRGGKVHTITKDHKVNAEILGHESHPKNATPHKGKKGKIPILKMYDRDRKGTKSGTVTLKKGTHMVHDPSNDEMHGYHPKHGHFTVYHSNGGDSDLKHHKPGVHKIKEEVEVDEALNLQQRMKRSRLMKRLKTRIKIGRDRARRKMANKKTLEKRAMRQARAAIAKKLTRGIPKAELTFARKQEIEKRLDKPALKNRIKRIAKRIFKDVRKKEVQRKKG